MKRQLLSICFFACFAVFAAVVPVSSQKMELMPGWNLVTLVRPVVEQEVSAFLKLHPMKLDCTGTCMVLCTTKADVQVGMGYWVFSHAKQTIEFAQDLSQTAWETVGLADGWNIIGVAEKSTWQGEAADIWQWKDGRFQKVTKEELTAGKAYFVR